MVSLFVVSEYSQSPPEELSEDRMKVTGPLYDLDLVKALVGEDGQGLKLWTRKCGQDVNKWFDEDFEVLADMFASLQAHHYLHSEWCTNGREVNGKQAVAACDAYRCRRAETLATGKQVQMEYYLKFAISKTGSLLLLVSCHAST